METKPKETTGALAAAGCYFLWGLVPLYWRQLTEVGALELIAHRIAWSLVFLAAILSVKAGFGELRIALSNRRSLLVNLFSSLLLTINWLIYVWAVNAGHIIETSLGYFLVPLVNVAIGRFVLGEHLRRLQWIAVGCAAAGVLWQVLQVGRWPWIALVIAASWGGYGLCRKKSPLGPIDGLAAETAILFPLAVGFLLWQHGSSQGALGRVDFQTHLYVLSAGVVTTVPLLLFAYAARRIRFATLGLLQYIAPTVQFAIGVWVYREAFTAERAISFGVIWLGLALYTADNLMAQRRKHF